MKLEHWQILYDVSNNDLGEAIGKHPATVNKYHNGAVPGKVTMRRIFIVTGGLVVPNDFHDLSLNNLTDEELNYVKTTFRPRFGLITHGRVSNK